ncbi:MAG: helix-turn-helix domain-containing protein [Terracidiphilus sp.]
MPLRLHQPAFPLSRYVQLMWWATNPGVPSSRQRIYPDGAMALVIHLNRPAATYFVDDAAHTIRVPLLAGPYSRSFQFDPSESTAVLGVLFRPGAARLFFPFPANELHNLDIALRELHPEEADRLLNELCSASGEPARFQMIERYLTRKLKGAVLTPPAVRYGVEQLSREGLVRGVRSIQSETGLSHTRFIQLFREHVGLTPKLFYRVRRFRMLINRIEKGLPVKWVELATDCGYFDQAHLIRDFRVFAGITPHEYRPSIADPDTRIFEATNAG